MSYIRVLEQTKQQGRPPKTPCPKCKGTGEAHSKVEADGSGYIVLCMWCNGGRSIPVC